MIGASAATGVRRRALDGFAALAMTARAVLRSPLTVNRSPLNGFAALAMTGTSVAGIPVSASAHDFWANGEPVPAWVKAMCCGPEDAHHLRAGAVHIEADGYHIDGLNTVVPIARALPSPDGSYWGFWSPQLEPDVVIFCFFAPLHGS